MTQSHQQNLLNLAKQGQVEAINSSLNYVLNNLGISARAVITGDLIELIIEIGEKSPERARVLKHLRGYLEYLQIPFINKAKIYAKKSCTNLLLWYDEFNVELSVLSVTQLSTSQSSIPDSINDNTDKTEQLKNLKGIPTATSQLKSPSPIPFEHLPRELQRSIKRAGLRDGETRSWQEAKQMYEMIPENVRRQGIEAIDHYKRNHDWSHKKAYSRGGSNSPNNGDWEQPSINRGRGSRNTTKAESKSIAEAKAKINFQSGANLVLTQAITAGGIAFGIELAFNGLESFLAVQRGDKSIEEALVDTLATSSSAAITAAVITGGIVALSITFPPVGAVIGTMAPILQIVGGVSCLQRLIEILSASSKVEGIDRLQSLMASYGIDEIELDFRDLEVNDELAQLKQNMGIV